MSTDIPEWSFEQVKQACTSRGAIMIDVRPLEEVRQNGGTIPAALIIPLGELPGALSLSSSAFSRRYERDGNLPLVFFCQAGVRGMKGAVMAREMGYTAACYRGSWAEWCQRGGPKELK